MNNPHLSRTLNPPLPPTPSSKDERQEGQEIQERKVVQENLLKQKANGKDQGQTRNVANETYSPQKVKGIKRPGIFFIGGFDYFGLISKESDGLSLMAESIPGAQFFPWNDKDKILNEIKKRSLDQPIILVGHSLGGDTAVEVAQTLNSPKHLFRKVNLLVTLDSFGMDNDIIPPNVSKNLNFVGEKNLFLNDSPNMARNLSKTEVINELRPEIHSALDNSEEIQSKIFASIFQIIDPQESQKPQESQESQELQENTLPPPSEVENKENQLPGQNIQGSQIALEA